MPNPTKDDQREIATKCRKGMAYKKKNTAQNSVRTAGWFAKGNQHRFRPGQSGNPGGRPKKDIAAEIAQKVFEENADAIEKWFVKALKRGNPKLFAVLAARAFGNPGGRPQRDIAANIARAIFEKNPELIERYSRRFRRRAQG